MSRSTSFSNAHKKFQAHMSFLSCDIEFFVNQWQKNSSTSLSDIHEKFDLYKFLRKK